MMKKHDFLHVDRDSGELKFDCNILGMFNNGCDHSGLRTLNLAVSQEVLNGIN